MAKILHTFDLDFSDLPAASQTRSFTITGDIGAEFMLEVKNEDNYYYNFQSSSFQATKTSLDVKLTTKKYNNVIIFPTVTDNDQYDISFWAKVGTEHADYNEVRFPDNTLDINSTVGSNSLLIQKVIYQYLDVTLTLSPYSPNSIANIIEDSSKVEHAITVPRFGSSALQAFTVSCSVGNVAQSYQIIKQPTANDILTFNQLTVGSAELLPGENEYPTVSNTDTVDGAIVGGVSNVKVVMDTDVADKMVIRDKITATVSTDTVDGAVANASKIVMDNNVAGKMAVGDRVTIADTDYSPAVVAQYSAYKELQTNVIIVKRLDPDGDNAKEFSMGVNTHDGDNASVTIPDGMTLTFTPKCNRSLTTVAALNPDDDNTKEFSMSQNIGFVDGVTLSFSKRKNYQWPVDDIKNVLEGMQVFPSGNILTDTEIANYEDTITLNEGTANEQVIIQNSAPFKTTKNQTPTITNGVLTTQAGNIVFNKQQPEVLTNDNIYVGGYGTQAIFNIKGYNLRFSDLKIELDVVTTTTTAAVVNSTTIPVASVNGILPGVSTVSGIGIDPSVADPTVVSRSVTSGAGELTLSAAQNLESGVTLTFANAGQKATITGNVEIVRASYRTAPHVRFDVEKLLSIT
jgi:hypothetical protein